MDRKACFLCEFMCTPIFLSCMNPLLLVLYETASYLRWHQFSFCKEEGLALSPFSEAKSFLPGCAISRSGVKGFSSSNSCARQYDRTYASVLFYSGETTNCHVLVIANKWPSGHALPTFVEGSQKNNGLGATGLPGRPRCPSQAIFWAEAQKCWFSTI